MVGAFADLIGRRYAWMGGFIAVTSVMILFYYSVVTGWTLKYVLASLGGQLDGPGAEQYWVDYSASVWQPLGFHAVSVLIGAAIISRGVVQGIERANKVLIPLLLGLLIVAVVRSVTLPGAERGLRFLFNPDLTLLWNYRTWLEALTQSAWSTGAGAHGPRDPPPDDHDDQDEGEVADEHRQPEAVASLGLVVDAGRVKLADIPLAALAIGREVDLAASGQVQ